MGDHHAQLAGRERRLVVRLLVGQRRDRHRLVADIHVVGRLQRLLALRAVEPDLVIGRVGFGFVEHAAAVGPKLRHEAVRRVAGVLAGDEAVAGDAELVVDLLGVGDDVVPGRRRLVGIEPGALEDVGVPDERHRLIVGGDAVGHAVPGHGLHGAGPEILGRISDILGLERLQIALGGELGAAQDLQADRHRRGIAEQRRAELVEKVVIGEGLFLERDVRIGRAEGLEEILVVLTQQVGVALEHALIPEGQVSLVVERRDL